MECHGERYDIEDLDEVGMEGPSSDRSFGRSGVLHLQICPVRACVGCKRYMTFIF